MQRITLLFITTLLFGCASQVPYTWQDTRQPIRDDATIDLEECRIFAARQYQPGIPAGEPYLKDQTSKKGMMDEYDRGEWRPDRSPFPTINDNTLPTHDVPVDYTGYPGELDYHPNYLDDILEKCMQDRGWNYQPMISDE